MTIKQIQVTYGWDTSTYDWYTDDIRVHTNDIRTDDTNTYEWHTGDIRVHTIDTGMPEERRKDDIRVHTSNIRAAYDYLRITYEWYRNDIKNLICKAFGGFRS